MYIEVPTNARLRVRVDDYCDPWKPAPEVVLVHGFGESGEAWGGWVPALAGHCRVIRIDQRGFGESSVMPADFPWSLDVLVADLACAISKLAQRPVHLVGAKIAGPVVLRLAVSRPGLVRSVTLVGSMTKGPSDVSEWLQLLRSEGVASWAKKTMQPRLGQEMSAEAVEWWVNLTARTPLATFLGLLPAVTKIDVTPQLKEVRCPVLVITTDSERRPLQLTRTWQVLLPLSELVVLPGDAYHPAAAFPDRCAAETLRFIRRLEPQDG